VVSFSRNVVFRGLLFSINVVSKLRMLSVRAVYVLSSLQLNEAASRSRSAAHVGGESIGGIIAAYDNTTTSRVLSYLANYTHRVALSNRRIVAVDAQHQTVTFTYRDYRHGSQLKDLTLSVLEFIRRFSLHILPPGLVRIRHYGILGNNRRKRDIEAARAIFKRRGRAVELQPQSVADKSTSCPLCGKAGIRLVAFTDAAGVLHVIGAGPRLYDSS
jgi:hypothetical protein